MNQLPCLRSLAYYRILYEKLKLISSVAVEVGRHANTTLSFAALANTLPLNPLAFALLNAVPLPKASVAAVKLDATGSVTLISVNALEPVAAAVV